MTQEQALQNVRRYDIDWLRTLAFGLLILYHVGMYYVLDWGWHVKSPNQSLWLQDIMILSNQWRMSLLFFVSGMALALYMAQQQETKANWRIVLLRTNRLLVPLIFSMYVIVPPQLYYELQHNNGLAMGYGAFLFEYWNIDTLLAPNKHSSIGLLTWNHLWFLPYLWCYTLLLIMLRPLLTMTLNKLTHCSLRLKHLFMFLVFITACIWLGLREAYPTSHDLVNDWYSHAKYFWVFVCGYALVQLPLVWRKIVQNRHWFLLIAVTCYCLIILDRHQYLQFIAQYYQTSLWVKSLYGCLYVSNHWAWILAVVGYAGHYLNFSTRFIRYANQAILPWYIFHQTLIVVIAMQLLPWDLPASIEAPVLILLTCVACFIGYELVRRTLLSRWLFGLKVKSSRDNCSHQVRLIPKK